MLNIIHRLKSGMFPALFFLTSASVLEQPLTIPPDHWQDFYILGGHTTSLTTSRPGLQPSVTLLQVTPETERQVKSQLWQVNGYEWTPDYAGSTARYDAFISGAESLLSQDNGRQHIAGAGVTFLSDVRVNFPGAEEPVKRWQGNLTPVVVYF